MSGLTIASIGYIASSESKAPQTADGVDGNEILSEIWRALETLTDPEIPVVSLREMGILRDIRGDALQGYEVVITPTYSGCPAMEQIHDDVLTAMQQLGHKACVVTPRCYWWSTTWMRCFVWPTPSRCWCRGKSLRVARQSRSKTTRL